MLKTTGALSQKPYQCARCGHERMVGTNHWGEIYSRCPGCARENPLDPNPPAICLEPMPDGYVAPPKWDVVDVTLIHQKEGR